MKIIVEDKEVPSAYVAHDLGKALAVKTEHLKLNEKLLTIEFDGRTYAYSEKNCNFFKVEISADFAVHKTKMDIPQIIAAYVAEP